MVASLFVNAERLAGSCQPEVRDGPPIAMQKSILWEGLQAIFSQHSRNVLVLDSNLSPRKRALFVLVQKNLNLAAVKHFCRFTKILVHTNQATENHSLQRFNFRVQSVAAILGQLKMNLQVVL